MFRVDSAIDGVHAKQGCYLCTNPNHLVDTEITVDYEGVLAICGGCAKDLAQTAGWNLEVTAGDWDDLLVKLADAERERDSAEQTLAEIYSASQAATKRYKERERKAGLRASA